MMYPTYGIVYRRLDTIYRILVLCWQVLHLRNEQAGENCGLLFENCRSYLSIASNAAFPPADVVSIEITRSVQNRCK